MLFLNNLVGFGGLDPDPVQRLGGAENTTFTFSGTASGGNLTTWANLFDAGITTYVGDSADATNTNITLTFTSISPAIEVTAFEIYINSTVPGGNRSGRFNSVVVEYSDNGSAWTGHTWEGSVASIAGFDPYDEWVTKNLDAGAGAHAYWRFRMTGAEQYVSVHEVRLLGIPG